MTHDQFLFVLRYLKRRQPFRPFWIELLSGDRIHVIHPETLDEQAGLFLHGAPSGEYRIFTEESVCQFNIPPRAGSRPRVEN
jgi:hypothetical protein